MASYRVSPEIYHRPLPSVRSSSSLSSSMAPSPRLSPLLPSYPYSQTQLDNQIPPTIWGLPLKYVSLVTLAVQNAALSIVMHYSRVSTPPHLSYSPASAVLLNELLKGSISFFIALSHSPILLSENNTTPRHRRSFSTSFHLWLSAFCHLCSEIFSFDCWKLSIPAILYVVQNSLQFVAISNLPVASFQVTYQMKILTTAAFSVALLRKKLTGTKWLSLFFLAIGVGIVQITQSGSPSSGVIIPNKEHPVGSAYEYHVHVMSPLKGFGAVTAACFTSGLAGVYFEMVLKNSKADLWVRNVQLSLFSLIPALLPTLFHSFTSPPHSRGFFLELFRNFGGWAWATVAIQVLGGLITAVVIKYSDNILKGFATSLSIVLSFLASVVLFDFHITPSFLIGASTVLCATWMYNQPAGSVGGATGGVSVELSGDSPVLGSVMERKKSGVVMVNGVKGNTTGLAIPGFHHHHHQQQQQHYQYSPPSMTTTPTSSTTTPLSTPTTSSYLGSFGGGGGSEMTDTPRYLEAPYGSPFSSKPGSRLPSRMGSPSFGGSVNGGVGGDGGNGGTGNGKAWNEYATVTL